MGLFSDHGITHVRDVACRAVALVDKAQGHLIGARSPERLAIVTGFAVLLAYLHDVGLCTDPPIERRLHAQYAAQLAYTSQFDDVLEATLATDAGRLRSTVDSIDATAPFTTPAIARELLAFTVCHCKSCIPAALFNDRFGLRRTMHHIVQTDLDGQPGPAANRHDEATTFAWMTSPLSAHVALTDDIIDAARILRAADAMRQRGTTLRTSAGYEIAVDARVGSAVAVLRSSDRRRAYLTRFDSAISVGDQRSIDQRSIDQRSIDQPSDTVVSREGHQ